MICIYAFVMPLIMKVDRNSYIPYLLATLPLWMFISNCLSSSTYALMSNAETLKRCMISSSVFPVADVLKNAYSYITGFSAMGLVAILMGLNLSWHIVLVPIYFIPVLLTVMFLCVGISYITPYIQDLRDAITIAMNVLIWVSCVIFPIANISEKAQSYIRLNPLYMLLEPTITLVYLHEIPETYVALKMLSVMVVTFFIGYFLFLIGRRNFVYYL